MSKIIVFHSFLSWTVKCQNSLLSFWSFGTKKIRVVSAVVIHQKMYILCLSPVSPSISHRLNCLKTELIYLKTFNMSNYDVVSQHDNTRKRFYILIMLNPGYAFIFKRQEPVKIATGILEV